MLISSKSKIYFFFNKPTTLKNRTKLKKFIEGIFKGEKRKLSIVNFIFCSDEDLLTINKKYLNHDYYTDIITFELNENETPIMGEIYISIDRVKENAKILNQPIFKEVHRVIFHGVLHLCRYNDKKKKEVKKIREKENNYLSRYFNRHFT